MKRAAPKASAAAADDHDGDEERIDVEDGEYDNGFVENPDG